MTGDQVSDTVHHGGIDQAVYAYAREDLDFWEAELGQQIRDGQFGENLTTEGIDLTNAASAPGWQIGEVVLEIAGVRTPCNDFKGWMAVSGFDNTAWVKRFAVERRPGPYLRVLATGSITAGDADRGRARARPRHHRQGPVRGPQPGSIPTSGAVGDRWPRPEDPAEGRGLPRRVGGPLPTAAGVI